MPYYLHEHHTDPRLYPLSEHVTKIAAVRARAALDTETRNRHTISHVADMIERDAWKGREQSRFDQNSYARVPWFMETWAYQFATHYAHMSLAFPNMVAYTPNDEYGAEDRQLRVTPGTYLMKFGEGHLSQEQVDDYCGTVRAFGRPLRIARTTEEILAVYLTGDTDEEGCHSPTSCMSHDVRKYSTKVHPVSVYGESDLGVAYLGEPGERIVSRAVVWPNRKLYTRVYGDNALMTVLQANGYKRGSPSGARIRFVEIDGEVVAPFVDDCEGANEIVDSEGTWLRLQDSESDCDYTVASICGIADTAERDEPDVDNHDGDCGCDDCETAREGNGY